MFLSRADSTVNCYQVLRNHKFFVSITDRDLNILLRFLNSSREWGLFTNNLDSLVMEITREQLALSVLSIEIWWAVCDVVSVCLTLCHSIFHRKFFQSITNNTKKAVNTSECILYSYSREQNAPILLWWSSRKKYARECKFLCGALVCCRYRYRFPFHVN